MKKKLTYSRHTIEALDHIGQYGKTFEGPKERVERMWLQLIEEGERAFDRKNMRGHVTTSMMVLDPEHRETLLIYHLHHQIWLPPGGHVEAGSLIDNALREVEEETGLRGVTPLIPYPMHIDTHPITARPAKKEGAHWHHDLLFLGVAPSKETVHQEEEVAEARWFSLKEIAKGDGHAAHGAQNVLKLIEMGKIQRAA